MKARLLHPGIRRSVAAALAAVVLAAAACSGNAADSTAASAAASTTTAASGPSGTITDAAVITASSSTVLAEASAYTAGFDAEDQDADEGASGATVVAFSGTTATVDGGGAGVDGSTVTITAAGTYRLSGTLDDGQVVVDAGSDATVRLVLAGVDLTSSTGAPLYALQAGKVIVTLAAGTENRLTDAAAYVYPDAATTEPDAALFGNDDLTINGSGSLIVTANYNDGIASDDDLKIVSGTITVTAADDGLRGKDSVAIGGGSITITAGGDGVKASNTEDLEQGYVVVEGGTLDIAAGGDGIQAETVLVWRLGDLSLRAGSSAAGAIAGEATDSTKGLKAGTALFISGGTFDIESTDDAVHSNGTLAITGGTLLLDAGDDGLHADASIDIAGGEITIASSYEGIESAAVTIDGGEIRVTATDDGINTVAGGAVAATGGGPGQGGPGGGFGDASGDSPLYINGGYLAVDARGDGIDANGPVVMTGGTVIVNGPTSDGNGALDFVSFTISGGFLVAVGSAGMAQAPDDTAQAVAGLSFHSTVAAGTMVHIQAADGTEMLTFTPTKDYATVVLSSPDLEAGATYTVYTGGSSTGTATDGLYTGGTYTPGTEAGTFTL
jgi:hypothetical protein